MKTYTLRIVCNEVEEFLRDVEILGSQTFLELHSFLVDVCGFRDNELASFYLSNELWIKGEEISLIDMMIDEDDIEELQRENDELLMVMPTRTMGDTKIEDVITHTGQRMVYEYDFMNPITLFIECMEIADKNDDDLPCCLPSEGDLEDFIEAKRAQKMEIDFDDIDEDKVDDFGDDDYYDGNSDDDFDDGYNDITDVDTDYNY